MTDSIWISLLVFLLGFISAGLVFAGWYRWLHRTGRLRSGETTATTRQDVEPKLVLARDEARQSAFFSMVGHELRTPLNAIIGYSDLLLESEVLDPSAIIDDIRTINLAGRNLNEMIDGIMQVAKIDAGTIQLQNKDCNISKFVNRAVSGLRSTAEKNDTVLDIVMSPDIGWLHGDADRIQEVLVLALDNAVKFTSRGRIELHVSRQTLGDRDGLVFRISDTGVGVSEEQVRKVFTPFFQADSSRTRQYAGVGLGLTICKGLAEKMGGSIDFESVAGEGSVFEFRLPLQADSADSSQLTVRRAVHDDDSAAPSEFAVSPGTLVLVIDDEAESRQLLSRLLHRAGYEVETAGSGAEGLALAQSLRPTAIVLDILMPDMDGWEVMQRLKSDPALAAIPVIMCTIVDDKRRGLLLGATDYLIKPISKTQLLSAMAGLCQYAPCHVLIIDDDAACRRVYKNVLVKAGWFVSEVENGAEGIAELSDLTPDIILLDLMMPEMDGFEFISRLRENERWRSIPVVVSTAKKLTKNDRRRLNGRVEKIVAKGRDDHDAVLRELAVQISRIRRRRGRSGEDTQNQLKGKRTEIDG